MMEGGSRIRQEQGEESSLRIRNPEPGGWRIHREQGEESSLQIRNPEPGG